MTAGRYDDLLRRLDAADFAWTAEAAAALRESEERVRQVTAQRNEAVRRKRHTTAVTKGLLAAARAEVETLRTERDAYKVSFETAADEACADCCDLLADATPQPEEVP